MRRLRTLLALITLALSLSAAGQIVDLDKDRLPVAPLPDHWRFHAGDDPAWADPNFDDSGWSLLKSDRGWYTQGYKGYSGIGWYRFRVILPASIQQSSILLPPIYSSDEIFADGKLVGSNGKMPPHPSVGESGDDNNVYAIPARADASSRTPRRVTIAIRVWLWPVAARFKGGGPEGDSPGLVGEATQLKAQHDLLVADDYWLATSYLIIALLQTFAAFGSFCLFLLRRREFEYLWFSLYISSLAVTSDYFVFSIAHTLNGGLVTNILLGLPHVAGNLFYLAFFLQLLQPRRGWLLRLAIICNFIALPVQWQDAWNPTFVWFGASLTSEDLLDFPTILWILIVLFTSAFRRFQPQSQRTDARLLLLPVLIQMGVDLHEKSRMLSWIFNLKLHFFDLNTPFTTDPFPISLLNLSQASLLVGIFAILILRFTRTRAEQERYATEVEGARNVQQFLIPDDLPKILGLTIESDYRPAREVGGDFFQIIPDPADGSALIFVGDVAGKGMQAGMLATLLVGAMRTAATFTRDPAVILSTLNNRLHGKGNATCLALRIEPDGAATLVNAGHLPPYLNGIDLPMEGALPLGTIPDLDFPIFHFQIGPGDTLTLISDGILEAQKPDGELFGFDRITQHLAASTTASSLATAAQDFGQEDDITVLTIARVGFAV
jgi:sigma-B regulation protein RsbU (phosphoserine phosphatase)